MIQTPAVKRPEVHKVHKFNTQVKVHVLELFWIQKEEVQKKEQAHKETNRKTVSLGNQTAVRAA